MPVWGELICNGDREQGVYQLVNASTLIGRSNEAEIPTFHEKASEEHCLILREQNEAVLIDMSADGTHLQPIGGVAAKVDKMTECHLSDGDSIIVVMSQNGQPEIWYEFHPLNEETVSEQWQEWEERVESEEPVPEEAKKTESSVSNAPKSTADRARELLASALPPDFFKDVPSTSTAGVEDATPSTSSDNAASSSGAGESIESLIEDNLICTICNEIFHNPINLSPCNHIFCGGCFALWYQKSKQCPQCRQNFTTYGDHHTIKRMSEGYLNAHPNRKRSAEELAQLDKQSESIKKQKKLPALTRRRTKFSETTKPSSAKPHQPINIGEEPVPYWTLEEFDSLPKEKCRQCWGAPIKVVPGVPPPVLPRGGYIPPPNKIPYYVCPKKGTHLQCTCCNECYPNRVNEDDVPSQECLMCHRFFCHLYWGCKGKDCHGCLGALNAYTATVDDIVSGLESQTNKVEADYFRTYIDQNNVQVQDILRSGYELIQLSMIPELTHLNVESAVCRTCFTGMAVPEISYAYRAQLTNSDLEGIAPNRTNCPYGKLCKQMRMDTDHAKKFNHVCVATAQNN